MNCYVPGQVLVLPSGDSSKFFLNREDVLLEFSELLNFYELPAEKEMSSQPLPLLLRVPEGEEFLAASHFNKMNEVAASVPNFHIAACAEPRSKFFRTEVVDAILEDLEIQGCGNGVKVAILDSGIRAQELPRPDSLHSAQFEVDFEKATRDLTPNDVTGHGTFVAYIINRLAPRAKIFSIKVFGDQNQGSLGSILAGLLVAQRFAPAFCNLSFKFSCDPLLVCRYCRLASISSPIRQAHLEQIFKSVQRASTSSILVASAGNNGEVAMPALFEDVIAVGAFDTCEDRVADFCEYENVPSGRYLLAPGGTLRNPLAYLKGELRHQEMYGTSFSAAFVTGVLARHFCRCSHRPNIALGQALSFLSRVTRDFEGYCPHQHGLGVLAGHPGRRRFSSR